MTVRNGHIPMPLQKTGDYIDFPVEAAEGGRLGKRNADGRPPCMIFLQLYLPELAISSTKQEIPGTGTLSDYADDSYAKGFRVIRNFMD